MSWSGIETFDVNTGQFHSPAPPVNPSGVTSGSLTFTGGFGVASYPHTGSYNAQAFYLDAPGDPVDASFVAIDSESFVGEAGNLFNVNDLCVIKDGNNCVFIDTAVGSSGIRMGANFGGSRYYSTLVAITSPTLPYTLALSWAGNIFSAWTFTGGVWTNWVSWNVSGLHDFTAGGGWSGWRPGFIPACQPGYGTFTVDNLRWGPIAQLQTGWSPPTGLGGSVAPGYQVQLYWNASLPTPGGSGTPYGYAVYRDGTYVGTTTGISYIDTGTVSGQTYSYYVQAVNSDSSNASFPSLPFSISTSPLVAYGRYVDAPVFKAFEITNTKGIEPRIWRPNNNTKFRA